MEQVKQFARGQKIDLSLKDVLQTGRRLSFEELPTLLDKALRKGAKVVRDEEGRVIIIKLLLCDKAVDLEVVYKDGVMTDEYICAYKLNVKQKLQLIKYGYNICSKCGMVKRLVKFAKHKVTKGHCLGYQSYCRDCKKLYINSAVKKVAEAEKPQVTNSIQLELDFDNKNKKAELINNICNALDIIKLSLKNLTLL